MYRLVHGNPFLKVNISAIIFTKQTNHLKANAFILLQTVGQCLKYYDKLEIAMMVNQYGVYSHSCYLYYIHLSQLQWSPTNWCCCCCARRGDRLLQT